MLPCWGSEASRLSLLDSAAVSVFFAQPVSIAARATIVHVTREILRIEFTPSRPPASGPAQSIPRGHRAEDREVAEASMKHHRGEVGGALRVVACQSIPCGTSRKRVRVLARHSRVAETPGVRRSA